MERPLVVVGNGITKALRNRAGPTIRFIDNATSEEFDYYFRRCKALVYPGIEDFGMIPVEVMASGRPVIAYGRGGAAETVVDGVTGLLFQSQTAEAAVEAVQQFEASAEIFRPEDIRKLALRFDRRRFAKELSAFLLRQYKLN